MLLQSNQNLEELIVSILAEKTLLPVSDLQFQLLNIGNHASIQGIYKALRGLEEAGVVIKSGKKYSLRLPWVMDLADLAKKASSSYFPMLQAYLPAMGRRKIWHFNNLLVLNNFWSQILLMMIQQSESRVLLTWMPHPWFHLAYSEQEGQYIRSLGLTNTKLYLINGGQTFLDHYAERYWQDKNIDYSSVPSIFSKAEPNIYINVMDDYVLQVKLDDKITEEIEKLYCSIKSLEDIEFPELFRVFGLRVQASLWLEKNPGKAKRYRRQFQNYFGIN